MFSLQDLEDSIGKEIEPSITKGFRCLEEAHRSRFMKNGKVYVVRCMRQ